MKLFLLIFFLSATENCLGCSNPVSVVTRSPLLNAIPAGTTHPSYLRFIAGDIISCDFGTAIAVSDIMLASSHTTVFSITGPSQGGPKNETRIREEDFLVAANGFTHCIVITEFYDQWYASTCKGTPFTTSEILRRADQSRAEFRGRTTHFDVYKCNSEHWVSAWRYGTSWTLQFGAYVLRSKYRSGNCQAPGKQECF